MIRNCTRCGKPCFFITEDKTKMICDECANKIKNAKASRKLKQLLNFK
jgi:uncharacterized Zn ribbon protein